MQYKEQILQWAADKGILSGSTPLKQHVKTQEEVNELLDAILNNDQNGVADAIGDIVVTLVIQAYLNNLDIEDCIKYAYNVISKRTGSIVNGIFVKYN